MYQTRWQQKTSSPSLSKKGKWVLFRTVPKPVPPYRLQQGKKETLCIELPPEKERTPSHRFFRFSFRHAIRALLPYSSTNDTWYFSLKNIQEAFALSLSEEEIARELALQGSLASYTFDRYKREEKTRTLSFVLAVSSPSPRITQGLREGSAIAEATTLARDLANTPGGDMTPALLAREAKRIAQHYALRLRVLQERDIKRLKMGALLGVARGSKSRPRFLILEHRPKGRTGKEKPIVFIGKGITFDSGGLDIKPFPHALEMHMDMSGGAAVLGALAGASLLKIPRHIIGLIPAAENMPSGESYRPGDILHSMSGKTIEVLNTDAEGRLVLADALTYAERFKPSLVIDVATLTGASMVALGTRASALFSPSQDLAAYLQEQGEMSGDYLWPLPLWKEYEKEIQSSFADIANINPRSRYGGAIEGAVFLWQFAKNFPLWAHLDIAPRMVATEDDALSKGATGTPVPLLLHLAKEWKGKL